MEAALPDVVEGDGEMMLRKFRTSWEIIERGVSLLFRM